MWLLSADQVANKLGQGPGQLYRRIGDCKRDTRSALLGDRPVIEAIVGNGYVASAKAPANVGIGTIDNKRQLDAAVRVGGKRSSGADPHQADLAAIDIAERIFF